ncbi:hypothetical protein [Shewanella surugensis]|uniref:Uncharacterized protein n=1 Tax=Shewanella surugensis TaxID=212020 RepID=A0ABT0LJ38_9GAMM|nr:hypothetical protein [Shewanella surugensis]MCL1127727.1 hypothetical protein [Shewanella surugensis]
MKKFNTQKKPIVEGLIWASLLTLILKRAIATKVVDQISFFKATTNAELWFIPLIQAIADGAYLELKEQLEWAYIYLKKNATLSKQKNIKVTVA